MYALLFIGLTTVPTVFWATNEHDEGQGVSVVSVSQVQKKEESASTQNLVCQTADILLKYQVSSGCYHPKLVCYLGKHMPRVRGTRFFLSDMIQAWSPKIADEIEKDGHRGFFEGFVKNHTTGDALAAAKYLNSVYNTVVCNKK